MTENWAFMSILNHNLAIPLGCLPSAVWVYMMICGIYGYGQHNNKYGPHYKWFRGNWAKPLSPLLTVKQRRGIGRCIPKREPCLCMGDLYTSQTWSALKKPLLHILPDYPAPFIHQCQTINMVWPEVVHYCLTCEWLLLQTNSSLF